MRKGPLNTDEFHSLCPELAYAYATRRIDDRDAEKMGLEPVEEEAGCGWSCGRCKSSSGPPAQSSSSGGPAAGRRCLDSLDNLERGLLMFVRCCCRSDPIYLLLVQNSRIIPILDTTRMGH